MARNQKAKMSPYRIKHGKYSRRVKQDDGTVKTEKFGPGDIVELSASAAANLCDMLEHPEQRDIIAVPNAAAIAAAKAELVAEADAEADAAKAADNKGSKGKGKNKDAD